MIMRINQNRMNWIMAECINESIANGRSHYLNNVIIENCYFKRTMDFAENGGVILIESSNNLEISNSGFYKCRSLMNGGAIYFNSANLVVQRVCASYCFAQVSGHFIVSYSSSNNHFLELTINHCHNTLSDTDRSISLFSGYFRLENTNSSMNKAKYHSGFYLNSPSTFSFKHSSFANNTVTTHICIELQKGTGSITSINVVHNNSPQYGVFYTTGIFDLNYCVFHSNQDILFYSDNGKFHLSHCYLEGFSTYGSVSFVTNNSFTCSNTYIIQFFNTLFCNVEIIPTFQPSYKQTPLETPQKTEESSLSLIPQASLFETNEPTTLETLRSTPYRSYDSLYSCLIEDSHLIKISLVYSLVFNLIYSS